MKESLQYRFARAVIKRLRGDELLAAVVEKEPFDSEDQVAALGLAENAQEVSVLVAPQGVAAPEGEGNNIVLTVRAAVEIFTTKQVQRGTAAELAARWVDYIAARLLVWVPDLEGLPRERPRITEILEAEVSSKLPNHTNLLGHVIMLDQKMHYIAYYGNK